jgi:hypothetical protein
VVGPTIHPADRDDDPLEQTTLDTFDRIEGGNRLLDRLGFEREHNSWNLIVGGGVEHRRRPSVAGVVEPATRRRQTVVLGGSTNGARIGQRPWPGFNVP